MSFVAKVFVVLNLIISAFFLYFATTMWAANTKWQKMYELEKTRNVPELAKIQKLEKDLSLHVLQVEQTELKSREDLAKVKREMEKAKDDALKLEASVTEANNKRDLADSERQEAARENKRLIEDKEKMHSILTKQQMAVMVERNNAQAYKNQVNDLESEVNSLKATMSATGRDLKTAQTDLTSATSKIEQLIRAGVDVYKILGTRPDQPAINGKVLAVRNDAGLVMLSVGTENQVKVGFQFTISKGAEFKGVVQVVNVFKDMCSAKLVPDMQSKTGLVIEANDDAQTHF